MKIIQRCMVNGKQTEITDISLVLSLNASGRGFVTLPNQHSTLAGAMIQIDFGRDGQA
ncbi:hypothetical protein ACEOSZ_005396, partial [Escherichia coli]